MRSFVIQRYPMQEQFAAFLHRQNGPVRPSSTCLMVAHVKRTITLQHRFGSQVERSLHLDNGANIAQPGL